MVGGYRCLLDWAPLFSEQPAQPNVEALVSNMHLLIPLYYLNNMTLNAHADYLYKTPKQSLIWGKYSNKYVAWPLSGGGKVQPSALVCLIFSGTGTDTVLVSAPTA